MRHRRHHINSSFASVLGLSIQFSEFVLILFWHSDLGVCYETAVAKWRLVEVGQCVPSAEV
jgi:hypothetical protein